jgi:hypothetical protein
MYSKRVSISIVFFSVMLILGGCNLPGAGVPTQSIEEISRIAALTVDAMLTMEAANKPSNTPEPTATTGPPVEETEQIQLTPTITQALSDTPSPTDTLAPTKTPSPTSTDLPCDMAKFVTDVTVVDGTEFLPGEEFTKTWRLMNTGSCQWTSEYDVVLHPSNSPQVQLPRVIP